MSNREYSNIVTIKRTGQHFIGVRSSEAAGIDYEIVEIHGSHHNGGNGALAIISWGRNIPLNTVEHLTYMLDEKTGRFDPKYPQKYYATVEIGNGVCEEVLAIM